MTLILDASVVVSGFIARRPDTPPKLLLEALNAGAFESLGSPGLVAEWRSVLTRPRILRYTRQSEEATLLAVAALASLSRMVNPPPSPVSAPDPGDDHLWALLAAEPKSLLVTGDGPLIEAPFAPDRVLTPRQALERLHAEGRVAVSGE